MRKTSKGNRLHIGIFGRRNSGKSSLLNAITRQQTSIVAAEKGTTTDPVNKPMEWMPLGPVLITDTAGIDDVGDLGNKRIAKTLKAFDRTDIGLLVISENNWDETEDKIIRDLKARESGILVIYNKIDIEDINDDLVAKFEKENIPWVKISAEKGIGIAEMRDKVAEIVPDEYKEDPKIVSDLVQPGETVILVIPIDKEAPKGRIILPQVQTLRELLDQDNISIVVKESELKQALDNLKNPPALVVTDSQAFKGVAAVVPEEVPMTGFSVLFSRLKGDLNIQLRALNALENIEDGDKILIAEACSHHPVEEDIGRVKIPAWIRKYTGKEVLFDTVQGHDFPGNLKDYKLVVHCGACMWNRKEVQSRLWHCEEAQTPISNYGLVIGYCLGLMERALSPFPEFLDILDKYKK